jgi:amino acid transporter
MNFQRTIGTPALLFSAVGGIIGSGWLFGPMYAAQVAGPAAILSWVIGGLLMIVIALTFAELAAAFPVAGGMVRFAELSHGPLMSFTVGWMVWLSSVVVAPVETLALLQYAGNYLPGIVHKVAGTQVLTGQGMLAAALIMLFMVILNYHGARFFSRTSSVIVAIKLVVPILTLFILLIFDFHSSNLTASGGFMPFGWQSVLAALPLGGVVFSFIGYSPAIQLAAEAKNPKLAIPLAIIGALVFCIMLYGLLQLAFIGSLKPEFLMHGWNKLSFPGEQGPFAGILTILGFTWLVLIIYGDALISPFGTAFIYTASTGRVNYAMSQIGFFSAGFKKLNRHGVPMRAILFNYVIGLFLFLPFPGWQTMVSFIISCFVISYCIGPLALVSLRKTHPNQERPFRLPCAEFIAMLAFYICNLLVFWTGWQTVYRLLIAMAIGFLVFIYRGIYVVNKSEHWQWRTARWLIPYLIGLGIISYLGSFGGGLNVLKFGVDFIVIAVFTLIIYAIATRSSKASTNNDELVLTTANE